MKPEVYRSSKLEFSRYLVLDPGMFLPRVHLQPRSALLNFRGLFALLELTDELLDIPSLVRNIFYSFLLRLPILFLNLIREYLLCLVVVTFAIFVIC